MFKVCFYDGPGTYNTGTEKTISWDIYREGFELWENHYENGNPPGIKRKGYLKHLQLIARPQGKYRQSAKEKD